MKRLITGLFGCKGKRREEKIVSNVTSHLRPCSSSECVSFNYVRGQNESHEKSEETGNLCSERLFSVYFIVEVEKEKENIFCIEDGHK